MPYKKPLTNTGVRGSGFVREGATRELHSRAFGLHAAGQLTRLRRLSFVVVSAFVLRYGFPRW